MSKRFVDTDLWQKSWFQDLTLKEKVLVKYIFENCDCAGVWNANYRLASFIIGETLTSADIDNINKKKFQFETLPSGDIFIPDFIKFQYGTLSENCKPHKPVIEKLKKHNLYERVLKGFGNPLDTLEEKEKEKEKEEEKEEGYIRAHAREDKTLSLIPSESEIQDYCATLGRNIDVKAFMQYYQASNWLDKNGLPVNWKQKVIAWIKNDKVGPSKEGLRPHVSVTESEKYLEELKNAPSDPMPESFLALREKLKIRRSDNELHRLGRGFCTKMGDDNPQENYANNGV